MDKMTVLEIVQEILSDINGDEVSSIHDTEEAEQVAQHVKRAYVSLMSNSEWAHTRRAVTLVPYSDSTQPTHMSVNESVKRVVSIAYNVIKNGESRKNYKVVEYMAPEQFLMKLNKRDNTKSNVDIIIDPSGIELLIINDKHPEYYTSFDDVNLVFDSYDSGVDSTLQESKVQAIAYIMPDFTVSDSFVPDLPVDMFSLLIEESLSRVQLRVREMPDAKAESDVQRQRRWASRNSWTVNTQSKFPNYGRKR